MPRNRLVIRGHSAVEGIVKTCLMQGKAYATGGRATEQNRGDENRTVKEESRTRAMLERK